MPGIQTELTFCFTSFFQTDRVRVAFLSLGTVTLMYKGYIIGLIRLILVWDRSRHDKQSELFSELDLNHVNTDISYVFFCHLPHYWQNW